MLDMRQEGGQPPDPAAGGKDTSLAGLPEDRVGTGQSPKGPQAQGPLGCNLPAVQPAKATHTPHTASRRRLSAGGPRLSALPAGGTPFCGSELRASGAGWETAPSPAPWAQALPQPSWQAQLRPEQSSKLCRRARGSGTWCPQRPAGQAFAQGYRQTMGPRAWVLSAQEAEDNTGHLLLRNVRAPEVRKDLCTTLHRLPGPAPPRPG